MTASPHRRWFRFSLRTLLVLVAMSSAGFGWLGYKVRQKQRERYAVKVIQKLGGDVAYHHQKTANYGFDLSSASPGPAWCRRVFGEDVFALVFFVNCWGVPISDAELISFQE